MRIGILALLHESNTFVSSATKLDHFHEDLWLYGEAICDHFRDGHHEVSGFLDGLAQQRNTHPLQVLPLVAFRATPSGIITADAFERLVAELLEQVRNALPLDGLLVAVHGAAVAETHEDADGYWLAKLRETVGPHVPIVGTLDLHANLSPKMVASCDALIAYRTNPHMDQRQRGKEAAKLLVATLCGQVRPTMAAAFPPLVINIERQHTQDAHLQPLYGLADEQLKHSKLLSNSILLGFPYADVAELGAATLAVTDGDQQAAASRANELGDLLWDNRKTLRGQLIGVEEAMQRCATERRKRIGLLDMGDNVGGGSAGDGTVLASELWRRKLGPSFVCLADAAAVKSCQAAGIGNQIRLKVGGNTDNQHGDPLEITLNVESLHDGKFEEPEPRHGGIRQFCQGPTIVASTLDGLLTVMLTSRRMVPFSSAQLTACDIDPRRFRLLVIKGVHAPLAAYRDICDCFIRINTPGATHADLTGLPFHRRRVPLYPFEEYTTFR